MVQKQRKIGILRAIGAGRRRIMTVFLLQGRLVGLAGSMFGSALAFGLLVVFSHVFKAPPAARCFPHSSTRCWCCWRPLWPAALGCSAARMDPVQAIRA